MLEPHFPSSPRIPIDRHRATRWILPEEQAELSSVTPGRITPRALADEKRARIHAAARHDAGCGPAQAFACRLRDSTRARLLGLPILHLDLQPLALALASAKSANDVAMFGSPSMNRSTGFTQLPFAACRFASAAISSARQSCEVP
jgi:hypothetical protein